MMTTTRYIAKCRGCGTAMAAEAQGWDARLTFARRRSAVYTNANGFVVIPCSKCGQERRAAEVRGKLSAKHECGAKCTNSTGPACECRCAGKNHGSAHHVSSFKT